MAKFELTEIKTADNVLHQGLFAGLEPPGKRALVWIHGLTGKFYGDARLMNLLADACLAKGMAFASFNNRGHDVIASLSTVDPQSATGRGHKMGGAGYEVFTDSAADIAAVLDFLESRGYREAVLAGHSSGANKACHYAATVKDARVTGVVLAGPLSDRYSPDNDREEYEKNLTMLTTLRAEGKGDALLTKVSWMPMTADRAWSLIAPNTEEDVFNYGDSERVLETFSRITAPVLTVFSGADEYADRPAGDIKRVFDSKTASKNYRSVVIPDTTHGYEGKEGEFVHMVTDWAAQLP